MRRVDSSSLQNKEVAKKCLAAFYFALTRIWINAFERTMVSLRQTRTGIAIRGEAIATSLSAHGLEFS